MLYSMLCETSLRVGLYTSPHLEHLRERIRVGDRPREHGNDWIRADEFASLVERLQPVLEDLRHEPLTYFEIVTALAFAYFKERQVEIAVLEVGLGGRLDATNVVDQAVSVIAPIALDHADVLGPDPASIAREKAGIIKPRQVVITAAQEPEVEDVLRQVCEAQGVPRFAWGQDLTAAIHHHDAEGLDVSITGLRGIYESLTIPLIGRHQAQNAALAVAALEALSPTGIPHTFVEQGLPRVEWPGRLEIVSDSPVVMMDGAHNPHAAQALRDTLLELWPGRAIHLLIGMSADKPVDDVGNLLGSLAVSATCTRSRHPRALEPTELARRLAPWCPDVHVMSDPIDAYTYLINAVPKEDVVVVTGSLFLVGELRAAIRRSHVRPRRVPQLEAVVADGSAA
jgi:dihydrofolate synthase/folylpolyglutamate synthase